MNVVDLEPTNKAAIDEFYKVNDKIVGELKKRMAINEVVTSSRGLTYNGFRFENVLTAVDYKLTYAGVSLAYLIKVSDEQKRAFQAGDVLGTTVPLTEDLAFHADVFFSFLSTAFDLGAWLMHFAYGTRSRDKDISFFSVSEHLAANVTPSDPFSIFVSDFKTGWMANFNLYRNYLTHFGRIETKGQLKGIKGKPLTFKGIMIPDDPTIYSPTFNKEKELVPYCDESFKKSVEKLTAVYNAVLITLDSATGET